MKRPNKSGIWLLTVLAYGARATHLDDQEGSVGSERENRHADDGADHADELLQNPFRCTLKASDHGSCVRMEHCAWCQSENLPGICVSEKQVHILIHKLPYIKCWKDDHPNVEGIELASSTTTQGEFQSLKGPFDSKCLNAPSEGGPDDDPEEVCNATIDMQGEMCVWCSAAGVFDLCLSHQQAEAASNYLQCDL